MNGENAEDSQFLYVQKKKRTPPMKSCPKWTLVENQRYVDFLEQHLNEIEDSKKRKKKFFFKEMSEHVGNQRNNEQCRSHHQKMVKGFKTIKNIIEHFRGLLKEASSTQNQDKNSSQASYLSHIQQGNHDHFDQTSKPEFFDSPINQLSLDEFCDRGVEYMNPFNILFSNYD